VCSCIRPRFYFAADRPAPAGHHEIRGSGTQNWGRRLLVLAWENRAYGAQLTQERESDASRNSAFEHVDAPA